jgi:uncharacterized membrane protein
MRSGIIDSLRGLAVIWMISFHATYDMKLLGMVNVNFSEGFWFAYPRIIAFTFLFCVGCSLNFVHESKINWKKLSERSLKLGLSALAVSAGSYLFFPQQWIYFGTLHCILVGSILGAMLVNHRPVALGLLITILLLQYGLGYDIKWVSSILQKPSMDFIPIYPWFWAILLGILSGPYFSKNKHLGPFKSPFFLNFLGNHSLKIYLIHQPIIYGALWLIKAFV